jgi:hypothetical protein
LDASKVPRNFEGRYRIRAMQRHFDKLIDEINTYAEIRRYMTWA